MDPHPQHLRDPFGEEIAAFVIDNNKSREISILDAQLQKTKNIQLNYNITF